jgi:hypothetical protein
MKTYKKKGWEKPNVSNLSIKSLTLGGANSATKESGKGKDNTYRGS